MLRTSILAALAATFLATPALAGHCPKDAKAIDHALSTLDVGDDVKKQVTAMRDEGMALHEAGKHAESEDKLSEAMRTLLSATK